MAVALTLSANKLELDLAKTQIIAERIGLSRMGYELIVPSMQRDLELIHEAKQLFKDMADCEAEVRAVIARKKSGTWPVASRLAAVG